MTQYGTSDENATSASEELLELLGDRYARRILLAIHEETLSAQRLAETTGISEPTIYRRLERLEQLGLVTSELLLDAGGNHYKQYRAVLERVTLRFDGDGLVVSVRTDCGGSDLECDHTGDAGTAGPTTADR
ncbi:winged helix-turn-helix domain-containing protein [Natronolimnohabitans sp. A-GB9]|uniref:ArsR/SmtB family transcription factor n=1 Tax=Natronolimnohabitans sp. A-GB9 TaxID=3069757 RepID=UPI0027B5D2C2|nr:winged helix-turn-helix domain-containing protein [Natronolimnohabitans sp. A-GB9]MDQ2049314.1 winged helix-turn-helix domain-containing protein [Natronolimnohabitans sp. A-GB9]